MRRADMGGLPCPSAVLCGTGRNDCSGLSRKDFLRITSGETGKSRTGSTTSEQQVQDRAGNFPSKSIRGENANSNMMSSAVVGAGGGGRLGRVKLGVVAEFLSPRFPVTRSVVFRLGGNVETETRKDNGGT